MSIIDLTGKKETVVKDNKIYIIVYSVCEQSLLEIYNYIKRNLPIVLKFVKFLIIYLIERYYYKLNEVYFVIKASRDINTLEFFIKLNRIKDLINFKKKPDKPYVRLTYYYTILLLVYLYIGPITWFLIRVLTDPQNWMANCLHLLINMPALL